MKVKVRVLRVGSKLISYSIAVVYSEDAKKLCEVVEEFKKKVREIAPYIDDVAVVFNIHDLLSHITPVDLREGIIAETSSWKLGAEDDNVFIDRLTNILRAKGMEPEIEIKNMFKKDESEKQ